MINITLNWNPASTSSNQIAKWRVKGTSTWYTTSFTPSNNLTASDTTTTRTNVSANTIYEFLISGDCGETNTQEGLGFACLTPVITQLTGPDRITINFGSLSHISEIEVNLYNDSAVLIDTATLTTSPFTHTFTSATIGIIYYFTYVLKAVVNGVTIISSDVGQLNEECTTDSFIFDP